MAFVRKGTAVELPANRAYILDYDDEGINAPDSKINHLYIGGADTETIELTPQGLYSTFILPFAVDEIPEGMRVFIASAYVAKYEKEWVLHLTEVDAIEANKPYVYTTESGIMSRAASSPTFSFSGIPANDSDTYTQGVLTGSHVEHPVAAGEFIIKPTLDGSVFSRVTPDESFTLPAHSAYIADSEAADINHMLLDDYRTRKALALKILTHLLGDLHQPLHLGHASDRGGNEVKIKFFDNETKLHSAWDSKLPEAAHKWSYSEWQQQIDRLSPDAESEVTAGTPDDWARETAEIATRVYNYFPKGSRMSYNQIAYWTPVVEQQFLRGGLRLASLLNSIFASDTNDDKQ